MSRVCEVTGKRGLKGNKVSHANNKSKKVQDPNLRKKRIYVPELDRFITVKLSSHGQRVLDKKGAYKALKEVGVI